MSYLLLVYLEERIIIQYIYSRLEELNVYDVEFLHGCSNPTLILIHQDLNGRHIKVDKLFDNKQSIYRMTVGAHSLILFAYFTDT